MLRDIHRDAVPGSITLRTIRDDRHGDPPTMSINADDPRATARPQVSVRPRAQRQAVTPTHGERSTLSFRELLKNADELLRLPRWTAAATSERAPSTWDGFSLLLDASVPRDPGVDTRLARALGLADNIVAQLRARALSPVSVAPEPLSRLGRAMQLDWTTFETLVCRDVAWFDTAAGRTSTSDVRMDATSFARTLRTAWDLVLEDEATSL